MLCRPDSLPTATRVAVLAAVCNEGWGEVEVRGWFPPRDVGDPIEVLLLVRAPGSTRWVPARATVSSGVRPEVIATAQGW